MDVWIGLVEIKCPCLNTGAEFVRKKNGGTSGVSHMNLSFSVGYPSVAVKIMNLSASKITSSR